VRGCSVRFVRCVVQFNLTHFLAAKAWLLQAAFADINIAKDSSVYHWLDQEKHMSSPSKILLFAPAAYNLAETTRMLEIAKGVAGNDRAREVFQIQFASEGGRFEKLIEDQGFSLKRIEPRITDEKIAHILAINDEEKFGSAYTGKEMIAKVRGDIDYLNQIKPAAVVTGSYMSMPVACQVTGTPLVWVVQSTWSELFFSTGAGITDGIRFGSVKRLVDFVLFWAIRFWMWYGFIRPVNTAARHFGVTEYKPVFTYFRGDITLVAEPSEFTDAELPENHFYIGPLIANQDFPVPPEVEAVEHDLPLVYFAMGSSGVGSIVAEIIESFRGEPYRVIAPVKGLLNDFHDLDIPPNVMVTDWLPALKVSKMADVSVIHGGIGTVMTAALTGKPVVGIGMHVEQRANLACLVRKGIAIRLPKNGNLPVRLRTAIRTQLNNSEAKRKAEAFSKCMQSWNGPQRAAEILLEKFGRS
jgi:UDP:flavonoid glycosyltransferase YjiC (YdhE family)